MLRTRAGQRGFTLTELLTVILILGLIAAVFTPRYISARDKGAFTACQENLKNLAVSLQTFGNDNEQIYPASLAVLSPRYLSTIPVCPGGGGADTYGPGYEKNDSPSMFTLYCSGPNHLNIVDVNNQPYYVFGTGLGP